MSKMGTFDINKAYQCIVVEEQYDFDGEFIRMAESVYTDRHWTQMKGEIGSATQRRLVLESRWFHWRSFFDTKEDLLRFRIGACHYYTQRPYWLVSPLEIQCCGYFEDGQYSEGDFDPEDGHYVWDNVYDWDNIHGSLNEALEFLLSQCEEYPQRQYLTKYYHGYFKSYPWKGQIDELVQCGSRYPKDRQYMAAPQPDRIQNIYQRAWPLDQGANEVGPPPQLFRRIQNFREEWNEKKILDENEVYEHLHALKGLEMNGIKLVVLRSKYDIYEVGKELRNCAFDYAPFVASKGGVLIKTEREDGRTVALGLFNLRRNDYDQIYGPRNEPADESIRDAYQTYMPIIREWADKSNV